MPLSLIQNHSRNFRENQYVYPVISRRSGGLSIGMNLSPTARCNFACIYCQVLGEPEYRLQELSQIIEEGDRKKDAHRFSPLIDLEKFERELRDTIGIAVDGSLFEDEWFSRTPPEKRPLKDLAFSGDGEPTLSAQFPEIVRRVAAIRKELCPASTKIVLITNGTTLSNESVRRTLKTLLENNGEIWAKLDAGTPEHYQRISRSAVPYEKVLAGLTTAAQEFPIVIQSCFLSLNGVGPNNEEIQAYIDRLKRILDTGGKILRVQIYTVARITPDPEVKALDDVRLDEIVETVRAATGLQVDAFYSS